MELSTTIKSHSVIFICHTLSHWNGAWAPLESEPLEDTLYEINLFCISDATPQWANMEEAARHAKSNDTPTVSKNRFSCVHIAHSVSRVIHRYDLQTKEWSELPPYHHWSFTMTEHNHQLTLVGGWDVSTNKMINTVAVYPTSQRSWKQPYPPMNTPRCWPAVSTYHQCLVVVGGRDDSETDVATVEILDTSIPHTPRELPSNVSHHYRWYIVPTRRYSGQKSTQCVSPSPYTNRQATNTVAHAPWCPSGEFYSHCCAWISTSSGRKPRHTKKLSYSHLQPWEEHMEQGGGLTYWKTRLCLLSVTKWGDPCFWRRRSQWLD